MNNTTGFTHWIIVILISVIVVGLAGASWYFITNRTADNSNAAVVTNTISTTTNAKSSQNSNGTVIIDTTTVDEINVNATVVSAGETPKRIEWVPRIDVDEDGILGSFEEIWGTSDDTSDTDGDGYNDSDELEGCYNPNGSGVITEEYFADVYCVNKWNMGFSMKEDIDDEQFQILMQDAAELCDVWRPAVDLIVQYVQNGSIFSYEQEEESFELWLELCEKTRAVMENTELNTYINNLLIATGNEIDPEDPYDAVCDMMSGRVDLMCGEDWGYN